MRFGKLLVVKRVENRDSNVCWLCKCDCGKETIVRSRHLITGGTSSCGCLNKEVVSKRSKKNYGEASFNVVFKTYQRSAKYRGYEFSLSREEFMQLINSNCCFCGKKPSKLSVNIHSNGDTIYNGIDRIDNSKGYIIDNVRACCYQCNTSKNNYSDKEFYRWIEAIYHNCELVNYKI